MPRRARRGSSSGYEGQLLPQYLHVHYQCVDFDRATWKCRCVKRFRMKAEAILTILAFLLVQNGNSTPKWEVAFDRGLPCDKLKLPIPGTIFAKFEVYEGGSIVILLFAARDDYGSVSRRGD